MKKKGFKVFIHRVITMDFLYGLLSIVILGVIICVSWKFFKEKIELSVFTSFAAVFIIGIIAKLLIDCIKKWTEDDVKLTKDYENLCKTYVNKKYEFINPNNKRNGSENKVIFPIILEEKVFDINIKIKDKRKHMYRLPAFAREHYDEIIKAHSSSDIYNQFNVRVKKWYIKDGVFKIKTERTTYYDSLVTNRAMDYQLESGLSVRDKLCYGPFLPSLADSELSNHLGFNGLLETSDHYIPIIKRKKDLSIGKRVCGLSVEGSIKTKEMLESEKDKLDISLLIKGIRAEYHKELGIPRNKDDIDKFLKKIKSKKNKKVLEKLKEKVVTLEPRYKPENQNPVHGICTAYRNIVEGGKPQFFTYYVTN